MPAPVHPAVREHRSPASDRLWRIALICVAALSVLAVLAALAAGSVGAALSRGFFEDVSAVHAVGTPSALTVRSHAADVRVMVSEGVSEVTLALVEEGSDDLPGPGDTLRARWTQSEGAANGGRGAAREGITVDVVQPTISGPSSWALGDGPRDLLILVPAPAAASMRLRVEGEVGSIEASGAWKGLELVTEVGDVTARDIGGADPQHEPVVLQTDIGDVSLTAANGPGRPLSAISNTGDVTVTVPAGEPWRAEAGTEVGEVHVDPGLDAGHAYPIEARTEVGDVRVQLG